MKIFLNVWVFELLNILFELGMASFTKNHPLFLTINISNFSFHIYNVTITEVGQEKPLELHPIEYICRHNNDLSKALRLFLRKEKEFMAII